LGMTPPLSESHWVLIHSSGTYPVVPFHVACSQVASEENGPVTASPVVLQVTVTMGSEGVGHPAPPDPYCVTGITVNGVDEVLVEDHMWMLAVTW